MIFDYCPSIIIAIMFYVLLILYRGFRSIIIFYLKVIESNKPACGDWMADFRQRVLFSLVGLNCWSGGCRVDVLSHHLMHELAIVLSSSLLVELLAS